MYQITRTNSNVTTGYVSLPILKERSSESDAGCDIQKPLLAVNQTVPTQAKIETLTDFTESSNEELLLALTEAQIQKAEDQLQNSVSNYTSLKQSSINPHDELTMSRLQVSGVLRAVDRVVTGLWRNAFCQVAVTGKDCNCVTGELRQKLIYDPISVAVRYAQQKYSLQRILIFHWGAFHSEAIEELFYDDPSVLNASIHRFDHARFHFGTGSPENIGSGFGTHYNINLAWNVLDAVKPSYQDYVYAYNRLFSPILEEFKPELILIRASFDSMKGHSTGGLDCTPATYQYITERLMKISPKIVVVTQEDSDEQTFECVSATLRSLSWDSSFIHTKESVPSKEAQEDVALAVSKHCTFWRCLSNEALLSLERPGIRDQLAGGHLQAFQIKGERIVKQTKLSEIQFYQDLSDEQSPYFEENRLLVHLTPKVLDFNLERRELVLENLLFGLENASIIDLKLGYKAHRQGSQRLKDIEKCSRSGQQQLGFRVEGVRLKDKDGKLSYNKTGVDAYSDYNTKENMTELLTMLFRSNSEAHVNDKALSNSINVITAMAKFCKQSKRYFRCSSVLLIVDNTVNKYSTKWIDFSYVRALSEDLDEPDNEYDKNVYGGLMNLIEILKSIQTPQ